MKSFKVHLRSQNFAGIRLEGELNTPYPRVFVDQNCSDDGKCINYAAEKLHLYQLHHKRLIDWILVIS